MRFRSLTLLLTSPVFYRPSWLFNLFLPAPNMVEVNPSILPGGKDPRRQYLLGTTLLLGVVFLWVSVSARLVARWEGIEADRVRFAVFFHHERESILSERTAVQQRFFRLVVSRIPAASESYGAAVKRDVEGAGTGGRV